MHKPANKLEQLFAKKQNNILNIYLTAGFPDKNWTNSVLSLDAAGVDIIEIGMPYSDPLADGPTIQESSSIALQQGMNPKRMFAELAAIKNELKAAIVLMGYYNQILQYGIEKFALDCKASGVDGLIIPDLPLSRYEEETQGIFEKHDIRICFLIGPESAAAHIRKADEMSKGFLYVVSQHGITGQRNNMSAQQQNYYRKLDEMKLKSPRLIGFGISDRETFLQACAHANGAIIGSAFIKHLSKNTSNAHIAAFVQNLQL